MKTTLILHDAKKELPKESGEYIVGFCGERFRKGDVLVYCSLVDYSAKHGIFNASDNYSKEEAERYAIDVDWWAKPTSAMHRFRAMKNLENS